MSDVETVQDDLITSARRAFDLQTRAMGAKVEGGIEDFLTVIHDDITWRFPMGRYAGTHQGKAGFEEFFRYACSYFSGGLTFHLDKVLSDGRDTVAFEFRDEGSRPDGQPYQANVTISYTMQGHQIIGYREYFG